MPEVEPDFNDPLWKLSAEIADIVSYCGPLQTRIVNRQFFETEFIYGFQHAKATKLIHEILEQELLKIKL